MGGCGNEGVFVDGEFLGGGWGEMYDVMNGGLGIVVPVLLGSEGFFKIFDFSFSCT